MLHHRTTDPGKRAEHIANQAAEKLKPRLVEGFDSSRGYGLAYELPDYLGEWSRVYTEALRELFYVA